MISEFEQIEMRPLFVKFQAMRPAERLEYLQCYFMERLHELSFQDQTRLFHILVNAFGVSAQFQALEGREVEELFPLLPEGVLKPVPRFSAENDLQLPFVALPDAPG